MSENVLFTCPTKCVVQNHKERQTDSQSHYMLTNESQVAIVRLARICPAIQHPFAVVSIAGTRDPVCKGWHVPVVDESVRNQRFRLSTGMHQTVSVVASNCSDCS